MTSKLLMEAFSALHPSRGPLVISKGPAIQFLSKDLSNDVESGPSLGAVEELTCQNAKGS